MSDAAADPYKMPGQLIRQLLDDRGWTQRTLALVLGVSDSTVNATLAGNRELDAKMALDLERIFGIEAARFLAIQKDYELARASMISGPDPGLARRAALFSALPIAAMMKRGWIGSEDGRDVEAIERSVMRFFGTVSPEDIPIFPHATKKQDTNAPTTPVQMAWLHRVHKMASQMILQKTYTRKRAEKAVDQLSGLLSAPEEARHVPRIMEDAGIRFLVVEPLPKANIDGVCFWLNSQSPVIGMSMRFDRIDNFWFVLRHEIEHVLCEHGRSTKTPMIDAELEGERAGTGDDLPEEERQANDAAASFCVPSDDFASFVARKSPSFSERSIRAFAGKRRLHPGLVAGQVRHHLRRWDIFTNHLVKIRSQVLPGVEVDGWGTIASVE